MLRAPGALLACSAALLFLGGCGGAGADRLSVSTPLALSTTSFDLTVTIRDDGGGVVNDAAVVLSLPVSVREVIGGSAFTTFTQHRTNSAGVTRIRALPVLDQSGQPIRYSLKIYKSGFDRAEIAVGTVNSASVELSANLTSQSGTTDLRLALLDYETSYRASDFLTRNRLLFTDITGKLSAMSQAELGVYRTVALGYDASKFTPYRREFIANREKLLSFVSAGGTVLFFQQNDAGWDSTFFPSPLSLVDEAITNDFDSMRLTGASHEYTANLSDGDLSGWVYTEPGQSEVKSKVIFDAALPAPGWTVLVQTPGVPEVGVAAGTYWAVMEYRHGSGRIFVNQAAYYQASFGTVSDTRAQKLSTALIQYLIARAL